jgi:Trk-type K+ transport system membrane component
MEQASVMSRDSEGQYVHPERLEAVGPCATADGSAKVHSHVSSRDRRFGTKTKIFIFICYYVVGAVFFCRYEGWNAVQGIYFVTVTTTTVGYGHFHPTLWQTKLFDCFFMLFGCSVILCFANEFAKNVLIGAQDEFVRLLYNRVLNKSEITLQEFQKGRTFLSVFAVVLCLLSGTLFYSGNEGWSFLDGLYWTIATMLTIGYGKLSYTAPS